MAAFVTCNSYAWRSETYDVKKVISGISKNLQESGNKLKNCTVYEINVFKDFCIVWST